MCASCEHPGLPLRFFLDADTGQVYEVQFYPHSGEFGCQCAESIASDWCAHLELMVAEVDEHGGALPIPKMDILDDIGEYLDINDKEQMAKWRQVMLKHSTIEEV